MTPNDPTPNDPNTDHITPDERTMNEPSTPDTAPTAQATTAQATTAQATTAQATTAPGVTASAERPWLQGPAPFAIVLGLLGLLVAGATLIAELTDVTFPWADLGPWTVVAAGLVVVLVGAIGLRSSRRAQA